MRYKIGQVVTTLNNRKGKVISINEKVDNLYKPYIVKVEFKDNVTTRYNYSSKGLFLGQEEHREYPLHLRSNINYLPDWF